MLIKEQCQEAIRLLVRVFPAAGLPQTSMADGWISEKAADDSSSTSEAKVKLSRFQVFTLTARREMSDAVSAPNLSGGRSVSSGSAQDQGRDADSRENLAEDIDLLVHSVKRLEQAGLDP